MLPEFQESLCSFEILVLRRYVLNCQEIKGDVGTSNASLGMMKYKIIKYAGCTKISHVEMNLQY